MGYYLNHGIMTDDEHVSVGDWDRLEEKTVMADDSWLAAGHFVSPRRGVTCRGKVLQDGQPQRQTGSNALRWRNAD